MTANLQRGRETARRHGDGEEVEGEEHTRTAYEAHV